VTDAHDLSALQAWMAALLRRRRNLPSDEDVAAEARRHITGNQRLSPVEQLEIYREQFWYRHTDSLLEDFPGVAGLLDPADWDRLVFDYLERFPPTGFTLRDLGFRLPYFIAEQAWLPHRDLCLDMGRLEWTYVELFDAPDTPPLDLARLSSLTEQEWQTARAVMNPACALLRTRYAVTDLRRAIRTSETRVAIPDPVTQNLIVYRGPNRRLYDRTVTDGEFVLLEALRDGRALVESCELAMGHHPGEHLDQKLMGLFAEWGKLGLIVDVGG